MASLFKSSKSFHLETPVNVGGVRLQGAQGDGKSPQAAVVKATARAPNEVSLLRLPPKYRTPYTVNSIRCSVSQSALLCGSLYEFAADSTWVWY